MEVQVSLWEWLTSFSYAPRIGIDGPSSSLFLIFWGASLLFHIVSVWMCIPTSSAQGSLFFIILLMLSLAFHNGHSIKGHYLIVVLICFFLVVTDVTCLFLYLLALCICSMEKYLFRSFAHFLIRLFVFLLLSCRSSLYFFGYLSCIQYTVYKYFLPFSKLSFHFMYSFFCCPVFKFNIVPVVYFCFCCLCFWCHIPKMSKPMTRSFFPDFFLNFMVSGLT